ncbi:S8 family peptidase [Thalassotalea euphylliae]|uniref:Peptidase S8 n=1 Tax=Thalassotalea euphylliae TaxID=1655234 RepID=A0A3E0U3I7_9GAMM|nr:S8 family peptidase [Thalassotalea euphylliae]REL31290.1 peptidase S8 [Thalassotalea euphylliae]
MAKNFLLGYGEEFSSKIDRPEGGRGKEPVYTYEENKEHLIKQLSVLKGKIELVPDGAKSLGKVVSKLILHPAYLAKSYYPESLLKRFSLTDIGSKPVDVSPRRMLSKDKGEVTSSCIFVAGTEASLIQLQHALETDDLNATQKKDVVKIENIQLLEGIEKVKSTAEGAIKYEAVLHTPIDDRALVINQFKSYAQSCGSVISSSNIINAGGLSFLSITCDEDTIEKVSEFTLLRAIRVMPQLGIHKPVVTRELVSDQVVNLPTEAAIDTNIKVAIFDGGIGTDSIDKWCKEHTFSSSSTASEYLHHGSEVTSLVLFGNVQEGQKELPRPYANVQHYRVIDPSLDPSDIDSLDVLARIIDVLEREKFDFINLSLGPRLPIEDDEVHSWTSAIEPFLSDGNTLLTVAVGNDGNQSSPQKSRVQVPSDLVNALAVGASNNDEDDFWGPADYSCIGPGRSPGVVKPDVVAFGGSSHDMVRIYSPLTKLLTHNAGTSFASPLVLRAAIGTKVMLPDDQPTLLAKALLIHNTNRNGYHWHHVGWGKTPSDIDKILYTEDNEATIIYKDVVPQSGCKRLLIPMPDIALKGQITLKATFCYATQTLPEHPIHYTNSGLVVKFKPKGADSAAEGFFTNKKMYGDEIELRANAHKWENTIHNETIRKPSDLSDPCFEIDHQEREGGNRTTGAPPLPFILVVSIKASGSSDLYNAIVQKHQVLQPLRTKVEIPILT